MNEWLRLFLEKAPISPVPGQVLSDEEALSCAVAQAFEGYGFTSPNPSVGCVMLDSQNKFLAAGAHLRAGKPHAEIRALMQLAGGASFNVQNGLSWDLSSIPIEKLRGARVFVTLEPCAHEGRTPSCAKTLASLPVSEVIAVLQDPDGRVAGRGFEILRAAGKKVRCLEQEGSAFEPWIVSARAVCEFFLVNASEKRVFVSLKVATSLDGMMGLRNGQSQWLTSETSRDFARFLRGAHEACLVGKQTVLKDDPRLDARQTRFEHLNRALVVLDSKGEILSRPELQIFKVHSPQSLYVMVGPECRVASSSHAQVVRIDETVSPASYLQKSLRALWERGLRSVWIEGGAATLSSALHAGIGDRLWLFQGPHLLGARHGRNWTEAWGGEDMQSRQTLDGVRHLALGPDHLTTGRMIRVKT